MKLLLNTECILKSICVIKIATLRTVREVIMNCQYDMLMCYVGNHFTTAAGEVKQ